MSNIMDFINYITTMLRQFVKYYKLKSYQSQIISENLYTSSFTNIYIGASCIGNKPFPQ